MDRFRTLTAAALLLFAAVSPGQNPPRSYPIPETLRQALDVRSAAVQELFLPAESPDALTVRLRLDGVEHTAQLRPYDVRSPDFRLLVDDGVQLREIPAPPSITYRGDLLGEPGSALAATVVNGQLRAHMRSGGKIWVVQPASDAGPGLPLTAHVVYERGDVEDVPFACATQEGPAAPLQSTPGIAAASSLEIARLAIDADEPFYRIHNRSITEVQNDVTGIINATNVIYTRDVGIEHEISTIVVRTVPVYSGNGSTLLAQFRSRWNASPTNMDRNVAHLFTGRNPSGATVGIAYLSTICTNAWAYGVSWTTFSSNQSLRVGVTAHELGHGWGAEHCSGGDCRIMCPAIGGCSGDVSAFGTASKLAIESFKSTLSCLSYPTPTAPPDLQTISPSAVSSYQPADVTLTGTELSHVTSVTVGGLPVSFTIVSADTLRFTPPSPADIATQQVSVSNPIGSGTIDLTVTGNHPSVLELPPWAFRDVPDPYRVHTDRGRQVVLAVSLSPLPSSMPGIVDLDIGNNFASIFTFLISSDNRGVAEIELTFPVTIPPFTNTYWQAVTFDPENILLPLEVSNWVRMYVL